MSLSSDVAGMRKRPQRQKTMTPIPQEPKGLEPRGCEGLASDVALSSSSPQWSCEGSLEVSGIPLRCDATTGRD
ncbi:hypothetical protein DV515_00008888 [Chloebia gouldiae]|uniref:Uncharacterized protein n=1 Tax=Chloebia gouldiae TaxID=44316 RepID=A0A3L8SFD5_CHLGU|nr:hypothetical protein DV515_00008888 [Chloebia gouldiae]